MILSYALLVFLTLLFFILTFRKSDLQRNLPPGPRKLPFIGNLHQIGELPYLSLQELSSHHGPLMFLKLGSVPTLVVSSAEIAKEIFKNHDLAFSGRPKLYAGYRLGYNGSDMAFTPYGDYWKEIRKIVMLELLSAKRVQSFQAVRFEEVQVLLHSIALSCGSPVNLSHLTLSLTNNIVCRIAFGTRSDELLVAEHKARWLEPRGWVPAKALRRSSQQERLLSGSFPGVTASSLRSRFKSKNFEGSSSNAEKADGGGEVDQPPKKKSIVFKKRKSDAVTENEGPEEEKLQLDDLATFVSRQEKLHSFDEDEESSSVWCKKFPFAAVADEVVQSEVDKSRTEAVGDLGVDQYLQVLGFRLASIGRSQEKKHRKSSSEVSRIGKLKEELASSEANAKELKKKLSDMESEFNVEKESHERISELLKEKEKDLSSTKERLTDLSSKLKKFEENKQGDILDAFAEGFIRAVNQAKFLFPDNDFGAMDPAKVIQDGKLVDDEEVSENDNPVG